MEIELNPQLRCSALDITIEESEGGKREQEGDRIGTGDIGEMDHREALPPNPSETYEGDNSRQHDKEPQQMAVGEETDEGADRVVGTSTLEELTLVQPSHGELVARHLYPHTVDAVLGDNGQGGDDQSIVTTEPKAVAGLTHTPTPVHRTILNEEQTVGVHNHIVTNSVRTDKGCGKAVGRSLILSRIEDDPLRRRITGRQTE